MESETQKETSKFLKVLRTHGEKLLTLIQSLEKYEEDFKRGKQNLLMLEDIRNKAEEMKSIHETFSEIVWIYNVKALKTPAQLAKEQETERKKEEVKSTKAPSSDNSDEEDHMSTVE